jgi:hypothetical protein
VDDINLAGKTDGTELGPKRDDLADGYAATQVCIGRRGRRYGPTPAPRAPDRPGGLGKKPSRQNTHLAANNSKLFLFGFGHPRPYNGPQQFPRTVTWFFGNSTANETRATVALRTHFEAWAAGVADLSAYGILALGVERHARRPPPVFEQIRGPQTPFFVRKGTVGSWAPIHTLARFIACYQLMAADPTGRIVRL